MKCRLRAKGNEVPIVRRFLHQSNQSCACFDRISMPSASCAIWRIWICFVTAHCCGNVGRNSLVAARTAQGVRITKLFRKRTRLFSSSCLVPAWVPALYFLHGGMIQMVGRRRSAADERGAGRFFPMSHARLMVDFATL